jgi:electron transfer flavoprotein alpha subunit
MSRNRTPFDEFADTNAGERAVVGMSGGSGPVLVLVEHDRGTPAETAFQAFGLAHDLAGQLGEVSVDAVVIGADAGLAQSSGAARTWAVSHPALTDYAPEAWGDALAQLVGATDASAVVAVGTDRGNEVLAHVAAVLDLPFAANATAVTVADGPWDLTRTRWGGSLLERSTLDASVKLFTAAPHAFAAPEPNAAGADVAVEPFTPELADDADRTRIIERVPAEAGSSLVGAAVVVSGGRGVGSAEGFAVLEELAGLLGGAVGCSRVVTNNGWRPHADQVGQTGKRIAPELYIACGISGAIQHWVGMMAAKRVLAINTDKDAPMVTKADYAVLGDLHAILPAIVAELRRRGTGS